MRTLGRVGPVSALSFGGGGIGGVYGAVDRAEAVATVRAALDAGMTLLDLAPSYGPGERSPAAERLVGAAFAGRLPAGVAVTTKVMLGDTLPPAELPAAIRRSLEASLERLRLPRIDLLLLHSYVRPAALRMNADDVLDIERVRWFVRPAFERLVEEGLVGDWGITGIGHPEAVCELLAEEPRPAAVQCVTNALDTVGDMWPFPERERPRNGRIRACAASAGVGVMGIRAVAAGALTGGLDRSVCDDDAPAGDYRRARAFRDLADAFGVPPAQLACRYALSLPDVATVIVGAKTRRELADCLAAEAAGPLSAGEREQVELACAQGAVAA
jgi:aryl-alcohol dehydrogenase-like predicted oxidoreductase